MRVPAIGNAFFAALLKKDLLFCSSSLFIIFAVLGEEGFGQSFLAIINGYLLFP